MTDKEYIERGTAKQVIEKHMTRVAEKSGNPESDLVHGYLFGKDHAIDYVDAIPAADVVEVVRCKDCKYFISDVCRHDLAMNLSRTDDFCSYGERKERT